MGQLKGKERRRIQCRMQLGTLGMRASFFSEINFLQGSDSLFVTFINYINYDTTVVLYYNCIIPLLLHHNIISNNGTKCKNQKPNQSQRNWEKASHLRPRYPILRRQLSNKTASFALPLSNSTSVLHTLQRMNKQCIGKRELRTIVYTVGAAFSRTKCLGHGVTLLD